MKPISPPQQELKQIRNDDPKESAQIEVPLRDALTLYSMIRQTSNNNTSTERISSFLQRKEVERISYPQETTPKISLQKNRKSASRALSSLRDPDESSCAARTAVLSNYRRRHPESSLLREMKRSSSDGSHKEQLSSHVQSSSLWRQNSLSAEEDRKSSLH